MKIISLLLSLVLLFSPCAFARDLYQVQKPPVGSQIDWGHPFAQGLVACFINPYFEQVQNVKSGMTILGDRFTSIVTPYKKSYDSVQGMTIVFDVKINSFQQYGTLGWGYYTIGTDQEIRGLQMPGGDDLSLIYAHDISGTVTKLYDMTSFPFQKTFALVFLESTGVARAFANGLYLNSLNRNGPALNGNTKSSFFYSSNSFYKYFYIYNRALSPQEINQLYIDPYCFIKQNYRMYAPAQAITPQLAWPTTRLIYD
jgi:hypothetical protein